ncbi:MAG: hypothetical protein ABI743_00500 [bacterium]
MSIDPIRRTRIVRGSLFAVLLLAALAMLGVARRDRDSLVNWVPGCPPLAAADWESVPIGKHGNRMAEPIFYAGLDRLYVATAEPSHSNRGFSTISIMPAAVNDRSGATRVFCANNVMLHPVNGHLWLVEVGSQGTVLHELDPATLADRGAWPMPPLPPPYDVPDATFGAAFGDGSLAFDVWGYKTPDPNKASPTFDHFGVFAQSFNPATLTWSPQVLIGENINIQGPVWPLEEHTALTVIRDSGSMSANPPRVVKIDWDTGQIESADLSNPHAAVYGRESRALQADPNWTAQHHVQPSSVTQTVIYGSNPVRFGAQTGMAHDSDPIWYRHASLRSFIYSIPWLNRLVPAPAPPHLLVNRAQWSFGTGPDSVTRAVDNDLQASLATTTAITEGWPCTLVALDSRTVLLAQLVAPTVAALDPVTRDGCIRLGLVHPPSAEVQWTGTVPLPPGFAQFQAHPNFQLAATPERLFIVLSLGTSQFGAGVRPMAMNPPAGVCCWTSVPWPTDWPHAPTGWLGDRAMPPGDATP